MLIHSYLTQAVNKNPDHPAIETEESSLSYRALDNLACRLAGGLQRAGVNKGDRVALFMHNGTEMVAGIYATLKIGAIFMPISPQTKPDKLTYILNDARAKALLTEGRLLAGYDAIADRIPTVTTIVVADPSKARRIPADPRVRAYEELLGESLSLAPEVIDQDLAAIIYTSGSTGEPKGVMLSHLNMVTACRSVSTYLGLLQTDRIFCALPLSFDYGLYQVLMASRVSATIVLARSFAFPGDAMAMLSRHSCTVFPGVPTMFTMALRLELSTYRLENLRLITNTAAALSPALIDGIREAFPKATLFSMYGLTECKRVSYLPPAELDHRPQSVGRGMPNQEVYLVDEQGNRLPPGSTGELVVRGSHVMRGYWEKPEQTAKCLRPGPLSGEKVLYTGDIFRSDDEGFLYFVGRKDDMIKCKGEKVSPTEVEQALYRIQGILEAAVIGVPDPVLGQAVKAFVVLDKGVDYSPETIQRLCRKHLESHMLPTIIKVVDSLPKTPSGKISKTGLRKAITE